MKKLAIILALALCFSLCACNVAEVEDLLTAKQVHITAGKIEPGMTVNDIFVEVTIDYQPVACRLELTSFTPTGYYTMAEDEPVSEDFFVRLDIFYSLPKGVDVDNIEVTMDCDGGEYDGTGSIGSDENGCVEAWSHAFYGEEPEPETEPATEPATEPVTEPETEPQTQPAHTHSWVEDTAKGMSPSCGLAGKKVYVCACGQTRQESIPALEHDLKEGSITQPTCTEPGRQVNTCTRCGAGFINEIPATGHAWSAWEWANGRVHMRVCSTCGAEEEANHNIPSGSVTCTDCGEDIIN